MVSAPSMFSVADAPTRNDAARGGRMVATDGRILPLVAARLEVDARGGLARVVLTQTFENRTDRPLDVQYVLPMPADGVMSGFSFTIGDERVVGEVQEKHAAKATFERAILEGRTAALVEQTRTSVFQQQVGNIPPNEAVHAEIVVDQPLRWLDEAGAWEWRFPTVVGPRYSGAPGRVQDVDKLAVDFADGPLPVRMALDVHVRDALEAGARPTSPSHRLHFDGAHARFAEEGGARLDRDVVVQWPVRSLKPGLSLDVVRPAAAAHEGSAYGLLTLVPPVPRATEAVARDLVVLVDTSGSMGGEPLAQAQRVVSALIDTLTDQDRIELIAFDFEPRRFRPEPIAASREGKRAALAWLRDLEAGGGTEMRDAVQEALRPLRADAQRQVVLVTDGYIGFEREIVEEVRRTLPASCRLHTVGVGSSVNRSLTEAAARAGAGLEVIIAPGEDPERAARRLVARTDRPVVTELVVEGEGVLGYAPVRIPDLFAGAPAQVCLRLSGAGGAVRVRGRTRRGTLDQTVTFPGLALGEGPGQVAARFARERVADLEAHRAAGGAAQEIDAQVEQVGLQFQIATRRTSWVAVSAHVRVDPDETKHRVRQPHEAPADVDLASVGLRSAASFGAKGGGGVARRARMAPRGRLERKKESMPDSPAPMRLEEVVDKADDFDTGDVPAFEAARPAQAAAPSMIDDVDLEAPEEARLVGGLEAEDAGEGVAFRTSTDWGETDADEGTDAELRLDEPLPTPKVSSYGAKASKVGASRGSAPRSDDEGLLQGRVDGPGPDRETSAEPKEAPASSGLGVPARVAPDSVASPTRKSRGGRWGWLLLLLAALAALWWWLRPASEGAEDKAEPGAGQVDAPKGASDTRQR